jgi:hypothetical protein
VKNAPSLCYSSEALVRVAELADALA